MIQASEIRVKLPEAAGGDKADKADKKEPPAKPDAKKAAKPPTKDDAGGLPEPGANP
jgi:hypothetical protein